LIRELQSHIKQVVEDTPYARSTLTSSIGYTFGPMVKLGIQSGVELQLEKDIRIAKFITPSIKFPKKKKRRKQHSLFKFNLEISSQYSKICNSLH
jgi:hypothetical protein